VDRDLVVEVRNVTRYFGRVPALSDLNLLVPRGRITVLLGPNGAGKTTAIRIITGALNPSSGYVRTFGTDPNILGEEVRRRCGVVSAKPALYDRLSGWDNLQYSAELYGLGRNAVGPIREAAARFGILEALDQQVGGYSTGMKTRLALARSVLHNPDLLLFDEPTSGLDPESSHAVLELIREMTSDGRTVVMCTHLLIEAEGLADQIIVLENGTDLLSGSQEELTRRYWPHDIVYLDAEDPSTLDRMRDWPGVLAVEHVETARGRRTEVSLDDLDRVPDLVARLVAEGVRLTRVEPHQPTLEDLYFAVRAERRAQGVGADL
jgi:ABC-2 type transport system ATP-binding protein